ncbi:hypothetical protein BGZ65_002328 [Modicella reniformis]|uniref:Crinkler effector protein N-terminal domain-containing protein n=1 Tax=Modicella reniformis TaxID=1440133 RepID=A0A9P6SNN1_9FUNG|nr:hypothetical protein BGZ65_002328 [Modicella reniformis]
MATLNLFCLADKKSILEAFSVNIAAESTIGDLKEAIKSKRKTAFKLIDAKELTLWKVSISIMNGDYKQPISLDSPDIFKEKKKLLPKSRISDVFPSNPDKDTVVLIQPPSSDPQEWPETKRTRIIEGWEPYKASDGKTVDLPLTWIQILESTDVDPKPRAAFNHLKSNFSAGDTINIPSLGQDPKDLKDCSNNFFVTEQMLELWEDLRGENDRICRRVLSGPMGVGKTYLSYFLAARAYAEGWPLLYIADAGVLNTDKEEEAAMEILKRFLALNKDILTATELERLVEDYDDTLDISRRAISVIFRRSLQQRKRKTLLIVDEHWKLYKTTRSIPEKSRSLYPLESFHQWKEECKWSRVVFTGIAYSEYEMERLDDSYKWESLLFVGPLSERVFLKLLDTYPNLNLPEIKNEVKAITNCVPGELVHLSNFAKANPDVAIKDVLRSYSVERTIHFQQLVNNHYNTSSEFVKGMYYHTLASIFLGDTTMTGFEQYFLEPGFVYRRRDGLFKMTVEYHIFCRPTQKALLELFKMLQVPKDIKMGIHLGNLSRENFEKALFHQLVRATKPISLDATDLNDQNPTTITLDFVHYDLIKTDKVSLGPGHDGVLSRAYRGYPLFDYMLGAMFIQVSDSDFESHNNKSKTNIQEAFRKGFQKDKNQNQIECYMNDMFGPGHSARIEENRFVVTKDGVPVPGFRIVYIRGNPGKPANQEHVDKFPDVAYIRFEEVKEKLFKDIV